MIRLITGVLIVVLVVESSAGDLLVARAMKQIGDLHELTIRKGLLHVIARVLTSRIFLLGLLCMTLAFFTLLVALSWADVSLVGPASASLTFIANFYAARIFLKEHVDARRWTAAIFVAAGVALMM